MNEPVARYCFQIKNFPNKKDDLFTKEITSRLLKVKYNLDNLSKNDKCYFHLIHDRVERISFDRWSGNRSLKQKLHENFTTQIEQHVRLYPSIKEVAFCAEIALSMSDLSLFSSCEKITYIDLRCVTLKADDMTSIKWPPNLSKLWLFYVVGVVYPKNFALLPKSVKEIKVNGCSDSFRTSFPKDIEAKIEFVD